MGRRYDTDIFVIAPRHREIDARLNNWGNWARVRPHYATSPMFRAMGYRGDSHHWHAPEVREQVDAKDALLVGRAVAQLPEQHRAVLMWYYIHQTDKKRFCHRMGMHPATLMRYCTDARDMVTNRLRTLDRPKSQ